MLRRPHSGFFHHFERFIEEYECRFEREYGYLRPIIQEVVDKYLDRGKRSHSRPWSKHTGARYVQKRE